MSGPYPGNAPHSGPETSKEASETIDAKTLRAMVLRFVAKPTSHTYIGATCYEVEQALKLRHQTASARIRELYLLGKLMDSGMRRLTNTNRRAVVWVICDRQVNIEICPTCKRALPDR